MVSKQQAFALNEFYNYDAFKALNDNGVEVDDEQIKSNLELIEMEIESLTSILNQTEFQIVSNDIIKSEDEGELA